MDPSISSSSSSRRRRIGSVCETRMQSDDNAIVKAIHLQPLHQDNNKMSLKEVNGKQRNFKSDAKRASVEIDRASSLKLTRPRSIGAPTPPMTPRRSIGAATPPLTPRRSISIDSNDKSLTVSVAAKKTRSDSLEGMEKTPDRVKKSRSELCTAIVKSGEFDSVALRKVNSLPAPSDPEKSNKKTEHEDTPSVPEEAVNEENSNIQEEVKEFVVCQEIIVSGNSNKNEQIENGDHEEEEEEEKEEEEEEEEKVEKKSVDVKEMDVAKEDNNNRIGDIKIKTKYSQFHNRAAPSPSSVRKIPPPVIKRATSVYSVPPSTEEAYKFTPPQSKLQSLVDLVMWRDASRSTLVFGFGTFLIISSSYANDLNFSFISVVAYIGLIYLGVMFVFRSVIHRGMVEEEERHKEVGVREEEVKRMLRLIMPYVNESLFQLRALFSGDPSTTLKMGVVLFVLARCGSSITLWNLAKFGFLGAFTVPRIFTSYSTHFSAYGEFWVKRFRDAWESCTHKKAVALALFTLVWNLSSVTARVWAAFMLFVALRYYQHNMVWTKDDHDDDDGDGDDEHVEDDEQEEEQVPNFKPKRSPYMMMPNKLKKIS